MEAVGARLGRSSTRYVPTTVFTGPVRKWKKRWVPSSSSNSSSSNHRHPINGTSSIHLSSNGSNNNNGSSPSSHLLLYKWTPISINNDTHDSQSEDPDPEPPRRKFKYCPAYLLEKEKADSAAQEAAEIVDDESKANGDGPQEAEPHSKIDCYDEKPDINDVPMDGNQEDDDNNDDHDDDDDDDNNDHVVRQDLNESMDLSLDLNSGDGESHSHLDQYRARQ